MALRLDQSAFEQLALLRVMATPFRIRGFAGPEPVVDSRRAQLVWEPRRVTPVYAVPAADVHRDVERLGPPRALTPAEARRHVLDPSVPFSAHTAAGTVLRLGSGVEGFSVNDPGLADLVLVDFDALSWFEEEAEAVAHPRDPQQRIDVRPTSSRIRLLDGGTPIVDTVRAKVLWETMLPPRWYVPADDVLVPLEPSGSVTWCAYKGRATYRTAVVGDRRLRDIAWVYEQPLSDGEQVRGMVAFSAERLEAEVDGIVIEARGMPGE